MLTSHAPTARASCANTGRIQSWGGFAEGRNDLFTNPLPADIGKERGESVVLRRLTRRGVVAMPKSVRAERMAENLDVFDFRLTDEQLARIGTLDTGASLFFDHRDPRSSPGSPGVARTPEPSGRGPVHVQVSRRTTGSEDTGKIFPECACPERKSVASCVMY